MTGSTTNPDVDRKSEVYGWSSVMLVLSTLAVVLRFISRRSVKSLYKWDDWSILLALVRHIVSLIITMNAFNADINSPSASRLVYCQLCPRGNTIWVGRYQRQPKIRFGITFSLPGYMTSVI